MKLYHGSSAAIEHPDVTFNKGFSDLGQGFYLTDDLEVARSRAKSRARLDGVDKGMVTVFEFDEAMLPWVTWGENVTAAGIAHGPFGLRFASDRQGIAAWANYIKACRKGNTSVPGLGEPSVVRAWIANDDVEMICAGFAPADELAEFIDPADLVVQYCFRNQEVLDRLLEFTGTNV